MLFDFLLLALLASLVLSVEFVIVFLDLAHENV